MEYDESLFDQEPPPQQQPNYAQFMVATGLNPQPPVTAFTPIGYNNPGTYLPTATTHNPQIDYRQVHVGDPPTQYASPAVYTNPPQYALSEVEKRFAKASLYRDLLGMQLFQDHNDVSQEVELELRTFIIDKMNYLMGLKGSTPTPTQVSSPFNDKEVFVLKSLAQSVLKNPEKDKKVEESLNKRPNPPVPRAQESVPRLVQPQQPQPYRPQVAPTPLPSLQKQEAPPQAPPQPQQPRTVSIQPLVPQPEAPMPKAPRKIPKENEVVVERGKRFRIKHLAVQEEQYEDIKIAGQPLSHKLELLGIGEDIYVSKLGYQFFRDNSGMLFKVHKEDITPPQVIDNNSGRLPMPGKAHFEQIVQMKAGEASALGEQRIRGVTRESYSSDANPQLES